MTEPNQDFWAANEPAVDQPRPGDFNLDPLGDEDFPTTSPSEDDVIDTISGDDQPVPDDERVDPWELAEEPGWVSDEALRLGDEARARGEL